MRFNLRQVATLVLPDATIGRVLRTLQSDDVPAGATEGTGAHLAGVRSALSSRRSRAIPASKVRLHPVASMISRQLRPLLSRDEIAALQALFAGQPLSLWQCPRPTAGAPDAMRCLHDNDVGTLLRAAA